MKRSSVLVFALVSCLAMSAWGYDLKLLEMSPPKARAVQKKQVTRISDIRIFKSKGYIGETDEGLLAVREISKLKSDEQKKITKLVDDENRDRKIVFKEIAAYNKMKPEQEALLVKNFFEVYRNSDATGSFYREKGVWQKHFK